MPQELQSTEDLILYALGERLDIRTLKVVEPNLEKKLNINKIRFRQISKIVFDKDEDSIGKLTTVLSSVNSVGSDVAYVFINEKNVLSFYVASNGKDSDICDKTLHKSLISNFNGCGIGDWIKDTDKKISSLGEAIGNKKLSATLTTSIPSLKNKDEIKDGYIQSLEKFLLAMQNENYTAVILAKNVSDIVEERKTGYEELYTNLYPFISNDLSLGTNVSFSFGDSTALSVSKTFTQSSSKTKSTGISTQKPSILQKVQMTGIPTILAIGAGGLAIAGTGGVAAPLFGAASIALGTAVTAGIIKNKDKNNTFFNSTSENKNESTTESESDANTKGITISQNKNTTEGSSQQVTVKFENKYLKNQLDTIDKQLERIKHSQNYGMFDFAAYFFAENIETTITAANIYNALIRGEESYIENTYIKSFKCNEEDCENLKKSVLNFEHPSFNLNGVGIALTSMINSKELSIAMGLPKKSLPGLLVKESVEFGREIKLGDCKNTSKTINIGSISHLDKIEEQNKVSLCINDLAMHTLITGSTGSGKSTTTYKLINEIGKKGVKFLVIEPTKGEYKHIFGNKKDIKVYGTNCKISPLLKINPFSFPYNEIHILEHIDRLVEIFNACWPMYAAMPAILKDAILKSYENCGWDLEDSISVENNKVPSFYDVLDNLDSLLESSMYSDNTKADYKGALITRVKSLTQGLIKSIFTQDALNDDELFDNNVIIDISRIGSSETKSLIMGIMILKLNEYRISSNEMNKELKHITILEEAHHILPRVSTQASQDSGNIKGKAVEMLSNAIAEMRTYGQGFVIVDQSPNMLDISAIRNTNTKIIMRLSELDDRNDVGKSAALSEEQINEIPKLSQGVAIVYQNGWESAVLCKVDEIKKDDPKKYEYEPCNQKKKNINKIVKLLTLQDSDILFEEQFKIMEEFEQNEEMKKYLSINSLQERVAIVQELLDARGIKNSSQKHTYESILKKIREKIVDVNDEKYGKLLVNFVLINLSHITKNIQLLEIENMLKSNEINDFITLHHRKNIERIEKGVKHG